MKENIQYFINWQFGLIWIFENIFKINFIDPVLTFRLPYLNIDIMPTSGQNVNNRAASSLHIVELWSGKKMSQHSTTVPGQRLQLWIYSTCVFTYRRLHSSRIIHSAQVFSEEIWAVHSGRIWGERPFNWPFWLRLNTEPHRGLLRF